MEAVSYLSTKYCTKGKNCFPLSVCWSSTIISVLYSKYSDFIVLCWFWIYRKKTSQGFYLQASPDTFDTSSFHRNPLKPFEKAKSLPSSNCRIHGRQLFRPITLFHPGKPLFFYRRSFSLASFVLHQCKQTLIILQSLLVVEVMGCSMSMGLNAVGGLMEYGGLLSLAQWMAEGFCLVERRRSNCSAIHCAEDSSRLT